MALLPFSHIILHDAVGSLDDVIAWSLEVMVIRFIGKGTISKGVFR